MKPYIALGSALLLAGCASANVNMSEPGTSDISKQKTVSKNFDAAWKDMVSGLSQSFFVINNIEKESGIINVSYSTEDAEQYVDCGTATVTVGDQTKTIDIAADSRHPWPYQQGIYSFVGSSTREASLSGRVNIYMEPASDSETKASVNAKYVLDITETVFNKAGRALNSSQYDTTFQTGSSGTGGTGRKFTCRSRGTLEERILNLV